MKKSHIIEPCTFNHVLWNKGFGDVQVQNVIQILALPFNTLRLNFLILKIGI